MSVRRNAKAIYRDEQDGQDERMDSDLMRIESFAPDEDGRAAFEAVRGQGIGPPASDPARGPAPRCAHSPASGYPDARCLVAWRGDEPVARCSFQVVEGLHGAPG